jgi:hypothetical protein
MIYRSGGSSDGSPSLNPPDQGPERLDLDELRSGRLFLRAKSRAKLALRIESRSCRIVPARPELSRGV